MAKKIECVFHFNERSKACWWQYGFCKNLRVFGPANKGDSTPYYSCHIENQQLATIKITKAGNCKFRSRRNGDAINQIKKLRKLLTTTQ